MDRASALGIGRSIKNNDYAQGTSLELVREFRTMLCLPTKKTSTIGFATTHDLVEKKNFSTNQLPTTTKIAPPYS